MQTSRILIAQIQRDDRFARTRDDRGQTQRIKRQAGREEKRKAFWFFNCGILSAFDIARKFPKEAVSKDLWDADPHE
jgi:Flp pilus assembly protein TadB